MEKLMFKLEGEFITNLSRSWFWNENKPYEVCEELLMNCLVTDQLSVSERKDICQKIIEGRLKLVGVNNFELVEDNTNVKPLYEMINRLNKEKAIRDIRDDIYIHPINYIDIYSTVKSYRSAVDTLNLSRYDEIVEYFGTRDSWYDWKEKEYFSDLETKPCKYGLWLLDEPELIYRIWGRPISFNERDLFFEKLYNYIGTSDNCDRKYMERQIRYESAERIRIEKENQLKITQEENYQKSKEKIENICEKIYEINSDDMTEKEYSEYLKYTYGSDENYIVEPDNIKKFEGLVDPQGNFYSCSFGGHNMKAYCIMRTYYKRFGFEKRSDVRKFIDSYNALDPIVNNFGWIAVRNHGMGGGIFLTMSSTKRPTKAQINTIFDDMEKHDVGRVFGLDELMN